MIDVYSETSTIRTPLIALFMEVSLFWKIQTVHMSTRGAIKGAEQWCCVKGGFLHAISEVSLNRGFTVIRKVKWSNLERQAIWNSQAKGSVSITNYVHYFLSVLPP